MKKKLPKTKLAANVINDTADSCMAFQYVVWTFVYVVLAWDVQPDWEIDAITWVVAYMPMKMTTAPTTNSITGCIPAIFRIPSCFALKESFLSLHFLQKPSYIREQTLVNSI